MQHAKNHNLGQTCLGLQCPCTITPAQNYFMNSVGNANGCSNICEICDVYHNDICEMCDVYHNDISISEPELHFK